MGTCEQIYKQDNERIVFEYRRDFVSLGLLNHLPDTNEYQVNMIMTDRNIWSTEETACDLAFNRNTDLYIWFEPRQK